MTNTEINRRWLIKFYPVNSIRGNWGNGRRGDRLLSAKTAKEEMGVSEFAQLVSIANLDKSDKTVIRNRTGSEIQFICH